MVVGCMETPAADVFVAGGNAPLSGMKIFEDLLGTVIDSNLIKIEILNVGK